MTQARIEFGNVNGRASLLLPLGPDPRAPHPARRVVDVERRSRGQFTADPMDALERWVEFRSFAAQQQVEPADAPLEAAQLGPCVPRPRQVFAIGLNYRDHAREARLPEPAAPMVFTKFPSCLAGAHADVPLTSDTADWEVELVVVIGAHAHRVAEADALDYVAGYCVGQDISDRRLQFQGTPPQFSLGKSAPAYGPIGPALVCDPALNPTRLRLTCAINGAQMQDGNTREMVFPVCSLVSYLSQSCTLFPGDLVFTGTPAGVGSVRTPRVYLRPGDVIRSEIEGLGWMQNTCLAH